MISCDNVGNLNYDVQGVNMVTCWHDPNLLLFVIIYFSAFC